MEKNDSSFISIKLNNVIYNYIVNVKILLALFMILVIIKNIFYGLWEMDNFVIKLDLKLVTILFSFYSFSFYHKKMMNYF